MRYRKLKQSPLAAGPNVFNLAAGDYSFGYGDRDFYVDRAEAPAQATLTRLGMFLGEWFLDLSDGTDWNSKVLGMHTRDTRDLTIQARILGTPQVNEIDSFSSYVATTRKYSVNASIITAYGQITIAGPL